MYLKDKKKVYIKDLKVGDKFDILHINGGCYMASFELIDKNNQTFTIKIWDKREEVYPIENAYVEIELTDKELEEKYAEDIKNLVKALSNNYIGDYGYHEMDNRWLLYSNNIGEFASYLKNQNYTVLGYFNLNIKVHDGYDIGLIFQDNFDENRFWTHACKKYIDEMIQEYKEKKYD